MAGIYLGTKLGSQSGLEHLNLLPVSIKSFNKLSEIISYIEREYVDTVDRQHLVDNALQTMLQDLDPHSYYISAEELSALNEPLEGNFEGIGIEFSIQQDTIVVITPIEGGPSATLGIQAGDRIIKVEDKSVAGTGIANKEVMNLLRGKRNTEVKVSIMRRGVNEPVVFTITRDKIPIHSVDVAFMLSADAGYIKISRFSKTTFEEFNEASEKLLRKGMKKLVLDLRGNGGGFLDAATKMADEFLESGKLIVYTEGKARPRHSYYATEKGSLEKTALNILIDEGSASATEIIAGAIQDNDRGTIIGRRSFGKGLVQEQSDWPDGSAIRLTIARYYTPTGRCIQKSYNEGSKKYYENLFENTNDDSATTTGNRPGEPADSDFADTSNHTADTIKYVTPGGKVVYGGGGITPDIYIPVDTSLRSSHISELFYHNVFNQFAFDYADKKRENLRNYKDAVTYRQKFTVDDRLWELFMRFAEKAGVKTLTTEERNHSNYKKVENYIRTRIKATIARYIWNNEGFYPIILEGDSAVAKALEVIDKRK